MKKGFTLAEVLAPKRTSGAENEVICSRESKEQAPLSLNRKLVAFTLAEVLITLAVIGVVAALTIPVLIQKYQKKQLYSQFMKTYNTLVNAMDNAVAEHGEASDWNWGDTWYSGTLSDERERNYGDNPFENYFLPQLKYVKRCDKDNITDCFADSYTYLGGSDGTFSGYEQNYYTGEMEYFFSNEYTIGNQLTSGQFENAIVLADGSSLTIMGDRCYMLFAFDTNGKKGPNVLGRDLFAIPYYPGCYGREPGFRPDEYSDGKSTNSSGYSEGSNCDPNSDDMGNGDGCASRLLQEGAMNY